MREGLRAGPIRSGSRVSSFQGGIDKAGGRAQGGIIVRIVFMKTLALAAATVLVAGSAFSQSAQVIIKQRAQEIRDQNNVRQGVASPSRPAQTAQPAAAPVASPGATAVQTAQAKLRADLSAIKAGSTVTAEQKQQVARDILAVAQGTKPSQQAAAVLAENLCAAYARKPLAEKDRDRFLSDLAAVLNPGNIQKTQMDAIYRDIQAIFQVNDDTRGDAVKIADAAKSAGADVQKAK
jgi:hypothetical protein